MKKNKGDDRGFVYSTNPDFQYEVNKNIVETLLPALQKLKVRLETKHRAGKIVTVVEGFVGLHSDLEALEKKLKSICGSGGSSKEGQIIIQGDHREKIIEWLSKNGYTAKK